MRGSVVERLELGDQTVVEPELRVQRPELRDQKEELG